MTGPRHVSDVLDSTLAQIERAATVNIRARILASQTYKLGYTICPRKFSNVLSVPATSVRDTCLQLVADRLLVREGESQFRKPPAEQARAAA